MSNTNQNENWNKILEFARWSPSPHNTQPMRLKIISPKTAELYYDLSRGLPEGDPPARFALTAVGIFVESMLIAAHSMDLDIKVRYLFEPLNTKKLQGTQKVADLNLIKSTKAPTELDPKLLMERRTNRLAYNNQKLSQRAVDELKTEAKKFGHSFEVRGDAESVAWTTELNKRMVFYDLDESNVRKELSMWSRFTKKQAHRTKDGLSAECLHVPGWGLWLFMRHYGLLRIPGLRQLLQAIYWKNMEGIVNVVWLEGPFFTTKDYINSGHLLLRIWLIMAKHKIAYHPFGSVITNEKAHEEFRKHFDIDESNKMAWLLMRAGHTDQQPPRSERLPLEDYML